MLFSVSLVLLAGGTAAKLLAPPSLAPPLSLSPPLGACAANSVPAPVEFGVVPNSVDAHSLSLTWRLPSTINVTTYRLSLTRADGSGRAVTTRTMLRPGGTCADACTAKVVELASSAEYVLWLQAVAAEGCLGPSSPIVTATCGAEPPAPPPPPPALSASAFNLSCSAFTLRWSSRPSASYTLALAPRRTRTRLPPSPPRTIPLAGTNCAPSGDALVCEEFIDGLDEKTT